MLAGLLLLHAASAAPPLAGRQLQSDPNDYTVVTAGKTNLKDIPGEYFCGDLD